MVKEIFYPVYMQSLSKEEVADILVKNQKELVGKSIKADLSALAKGKLGEIKGKIREVKEGKIFADPTGIKLYPSYIKRFVRRGVSKIDESFIVETSDKIIVRIKPTLITRKRVSRNVQTALRKETKEFLVKLFASQKLDEIFGGVISGEIQKKLSKKLKKVYPLSFCEIREFFIVKKK